MYKVVSADNHNIVWQIIYNLQNLEHRLTELRKYMHEADKTKELVVIDMQGNIV